MMKTLLALCVPAVFLTWAGVTFGQVAVPSRPISFEATSVKPVVRTPGPKPKLEDDGRVEYRQEVMFNLLLRAYGLNAYQVSGPTWIKDSYYDIVATIPKGVTKADIPAMLRQLLVDRFHLSVHYELRSTPVYAVTVAKDGPKLQPCEVKEVEKPQTLQDRIGGLHTLEAGECPVNRVLTRGESSMLIEANTLAFLAKGLHDGSDRPVLDRSGLEGHFRIAFECAQANGVQDDALGLPSMSAALQKLGLKLEARREEIEFLVVDGGDRKPTGN